jgi:hypothetical protein
MLIRVSLIIAIVAGITVGALNFTKVQKKINTLIEDRNHWQEQFTVTDGKLRKTTADLNATKADLADTKKTLETTTQERDKALAEATTQTKRATQLADDLGKAKKERDDAQADLAAYKATGFSPAQVMSLGKTLHQSQDMLAEAQQVLKTKEQDIRQLNARLSIYETPDKPIPLPASLKGKIMISDPKWGFVVLNVGKDEGVLEHGQLLVNRDGKLVAKVVVTSVQKDRCIANVLPGWQLGTVMEGDQVIPAYPAS